MRVTHTLEWLLFQRIDKWCWHWNVLSHLLVLNEISYLLRCIQGNPAMKKRNEMEWSDYVLSLKCRLQKLSNARPSNLANQFRIKYLNHQVSRRRGDRFSFRRIGMCVRKDQCTWNLMYSFSCVHISITMELKCVQRELAREKDSCVHIWCWWKLNVFVMQV